MIHEALRVKWGAYRAAWDRERLLNELPLLLAQRAVVLNQIDHKLIPRKKATPKGGFSLQLFLIRSVRNRSEFRTSASGQRSADVALSSYRGRGERIRTSGPYLPNVALYLAKLHPESMRVCISAR